ncbi:MAG: hypothetical protein DMD81_12210 [Candidatus Rokuibacteriota bacterium]|nr:MAG: hypothetical protein DMD81_12210 [Candidatus Rokubacteria bacterium]
MRLTRSLRIVGTVAAASVVGALAAALFLTGLAAKERDDRFCVSCHLHDEKFTRLVASSPADLAGLHHTKDAKVGCIGCHGGADLPMRFRVWAVAGFDTLRFLAGTYTEPTHMRLPLRNAECRQCHTPILKPVSARTGSSAVAATGAAAAVDPSDESTVRHEEETEGRGGTSYHAIREHETVRSACTRCHSSHSTDSDATNRFISKSRVVPICRECHPTM